MVFLVAAIYIVGIMMAGPEASRPLTVAALATIYALSAHQAGWF